jgi:CubicO group peptidase (beta-lactamase class C family)
MSGSLAMRKPFMAGRRVSHLVRVPRELDAITDIDPRECDPADAGILPSRAAGLWQAVENLYRTGCYPAVMFCLRRNGQLVFNRALGHARGNAPLDEPEVQAPMRARISTPTCVFSASKAPSAMVLHRMEQEGLIRLLDPVAHYIPEFAAHGKGRTTIYHLLAHRAGVPGISGVFDPRVVLDHDLSLELICASEPRHRLGRRQAYHAITAGVIVGEIVRRVTGADIRQAWRRWFKQPMGLRDFDYGADARVRSRVASQALTGVQGLSLVDRFAREVLGATLGEIMQLVEGDAGFYRAIIPAGNMVTTAEEISAFYQMLLDGGQWQGRQILRPETVFRATHEAGPHVFDRTLGIPMRFSPGFMLGGSPIGLFGPQSGDAFGHIGLVNNITWADPRRGISVALLVSGIPLVASNLPALLRVLMAIAAACPADGQPA